MSARTASRELFCSRKDLTEMAEAARAAGYEVTRTADTLDIRGKKRTGRVTVRDLTPEELQRLSGGRPTEYRHYTFEGKVARRVATLAARKVWHLVGTASCYSWHRCGTEGQAIREHREDCGDECPAEILEIHEDDGQVA